MNLITEIYQIKNILKKYLGNKTVLFTEAIMQLITQQVPL